MAAGAPSLAAAVLDLPGQDNVPAPSAWREGFDQLADADILGRVFAACKTGQQWALRLAGSFRVHLAVPAVRPAELASDVSVPRDTTAASATGSCNLRAWAAKLGSVREALNVRGLLPTTLGLTIPPGALDDPSTRQQTVQLIQMIPATLGPAGAGIRQLHLDIGEKSFGGRWEVLVFLQQVAKAFPNVHTLDLAHDMTWLPSATELPRLKHIRVKTSSVFNDGLCGTLTQYLPQLQSLHLQMNIVFWDSIFKDQSTSRTLTELHTNKPLDDKLASLLCTYTPCLKRVGAQKITVTSASRTKTWSVEEVQVPGSVSNWHRLPGSINGRTTIRSTGGQAMYLCAKPGEGLKHAIVQRLPDFIFTNKRIHVAPWLASRQEETLTPVLAHIPLLNAPYATVDLARWTWTLEMLDLLRGALPTLQHLKLSINTTQVVADDIFSSMLRLGSRMESLSLGGVNLQSHRYKTRRWPWAKCVIQSINVAGVIKLPRPNRHTVVQFGSLQLAGASQDDITAFAKWARDVRWGNKQGASISLMAQQQHNPQDPTPESAVQLQLSALQRVRLASSADQANVTLSLSVPMTSEVMAVLRGLPAWACRLDLTACEWPLPAHHYTQLRQMLPTTYTEWVLGEDLSSQLRDSILSQDGGREGDKEAGYEGLLKKARNMWSDGHCCVQ